MADGEQNDMKRKDEDRSEETSETSVSSNDTQSKNRPDKPTVKQIIDEVLNCTVISFPNHNKQNQKEESTSPSKLVTVKEILGEILECNVCDKISLSDSSTIDNQHYGQPSTSAAYPQPIQSAPLLELPQDFQIYRNYEPIICSCSLFNGENMLKRTESLTRILPSYSSVIRQGPQPSMKSTDSFVPKIPPPSYAEVEGIYDEMPSAVSSESAIVGPDPLYLICPVCRIIVMTDIERERTSITHWIAFVLCVFMCWPCCLLPYYMKSCSYTHHMCPNCGHYFGMYNPF